VALTPLAIPMLAGPGAISTVIVLSGQARGAGEMVTVYAAIVATGIISFLSLLVGNNSLGGWQDGHPGCHAGHGAHPGRCRRPIRLEWVKETFGL